MVSLRDIVVLFTCIPLWLGGCASDFSGGGKRSKGFKGNTTKDGQELDVASNGNQGAPGTGGWPTNPNARQDIDVDYGGDDANLYVSATIVYNGENSGSDALFTFYMQRVSPAPERRMREIIQAKGDEVSSQNSIDKFCRCGQSSEYLFFWEHKHGRKGALHSRVYDQDPRLLGDWIVANRMTGEGADDWVDGNLTNIPPGPQSLFFGADTENPAAFIGVNPEGNGFLRTWFYRPNSPLGSNDHAPENRDDMRIGITCDVAKCPSGSQVNTAMSVRMHFSHSPQFIRP